MSEDYTAADAEESERVSNAVKALAEHFDAVTILCSRHEGSRGTRTIAKGAHMNGEYPAGYILNA